MNYKNDYDVAIIGGGITGAAIAYELSKYDLSVILLEKDPDLSTGTTKANSGILHAGFDAPTGSLKALTNVRGSQLYRELEQPLNLDIKWCGSLVVAKSEEETAALESLLERGQANGVPGLKILSREETLAREPHLSPDIKAALYAPSAGVIWPFGAAIAFAECAVQNGVQVILNCTVEGFENSGDRITALKTNKGVIKTKYAINAAGLYADSVSRLAGDSSFTITPRRGEYLLFDDTASSQLVDSIVFPTPNKLGKGILVCTTTHDSVFIGPNAENIEDKTDTATTDGGMDFVIKTARNLIPNIPLGAVITEFSGLRAVSDTDDFIIRASGKVKGLIHAAGMQSPGLTAAPAVAEMAAEILRQDGLVLEKKKNFLPVLPQKTVFRHLPQEEKAAAIKNNPAYGRIICRCETISEAEIVEAINSPCGARTLDGVKRRVRAGMGRCQGGFCGPRVIAILARELGVGITSIVKESAVSLLFFDKLGAGEVASHE